ncbi:MAG: hypothetical protein IJ829_05950 [Kiritimatiellae bacterium]|nr:hypothetical protein [Kiritimatiellia bacterium]
MRSIVLHLGREVEWKGLSILTMLGEPKKMHEYSETRWMRITGENRRDGESSRKKSGCGDNRKRIIIEDGSRRKKRDRRKMTRRKCFNMKKTREDVYR